MELYSANQQWATRPADERFQTLEAMHAATKGYADAARTKEVAWTDLRVEATGDDLALTGKAGVPALLTNYAFGQLASRVGAPAAYLRKLPATLAAQNLNHGLKGREDGTAQLLFHSNGRLVLRAATSDAYARIWNHEVIGRLIDLAAQTDLEPAHQTFNWSGADMTQEQRDVAQRALYASDHDMYAFLMTRGREIIDPTGQPMYRGIIVRNSEVGAASLGVMGFWFREVCGNHIIWGARDIAEIRLTHVGEIARRWRDAQLSIRKYLDGAPSLDQANFAELTVPIADTKDEVLDTIFAAKSLGLTRVSIDAAFDAAQPDVDGDPRSRWGFAQGLTRISQKGTYADERTQLDRAAGKVLTIAF